MGHVGLWSHSIFGRKCAGAVAFSEAVDLHPITIIVAILVFGGLWGFGVFFAIPLATLIKATYCLAPRAVRR